MILRLDGDPAGRLGLQIPLFRAPAVPPAVATTLGGSNPHALALDAYGAEVMDLLAQDPTSHEVLVQRVLVHRWAERDGTYAELVAQRSRALSTLPGRLSRADARA